MKAFEDWKFLKIETFWILKPFVEVLEKHVIFNVFIISLSATLILLKKIGRNRDKKQLIFKKCFNYTSSLNWIKVPIYFMFTYLKDILTEKLNSTIFCYLINSEVYKISKNKFYVTSTILSIQGTYVPLTKLKVTQMSIKIHNLVLIEPLPHKIHYYYIWT